MSGVDWAIRILTALVVVGLGLVAAVVSFGHALQVVQTHGQSGQTAYLTPLTIDGLVLVAALVLLDCARRGERPPKLALWTMALGIGATLGVNVLFGWPYGIVGAIVAGWPAVALVLTTELLMGLIRRGQAGPVEPVSVGQHALEPTGTGSDQLQPKLAGPVVEAGQLVIASDPDPDPLIPTARDRFAEVLAAGSLPSVRQLRRELRVGHPRASAIRAALATS